MRETEALARLTVVREEAEAELFSLLDPGGRTGLPLARRTEALEEAKAERSREAVDAYKHCDRSNALVATEARVRATKARVEALEAELAELAAEAECCVEVQLEMEQDSNTVNDAGLPLPLQGLHSILVNPLCSYNPCA